MPNTVKKLASVIGKASVLLEAMPYLQAFRGKIFVIKAGGAVLQEEKERRKLLQDILFLSLAGIRPVLIHGGGLDITRQLKAQGITPKFVDGLRVTDAATLSIVAKILAQVNRQLVRELKILGANPAGISGASDRILEAKRFLARGRDIGFVGKIEKVHARSIRAQLYAGKIPVVVPLGYGKRSVYNVNADLAGAALAGALRAEKFVLVTDVQGILKRRNDPSSLISTCSAPQVNRLIARGIVEGGMIPKTRACIEALRQGVCKTHMIDMKIPHGLLLEIFTDRGIGTQIVMK